MLEADLPQMSGHNDFPHRMVNDHGLRHKNYCPPPNRRKAAEPRDHEQYPPEPDIRVRLQCGWYPDRGGISMVWIAAQSDDRRACHRAEFGFGDRQCLEAQTASFVILGRRFSTRL